MNAPLHPRRALARLLAAALAGLALAATAQTAADPAAFPSRPLQLIVPFPAGGTADIFARKLSVGLGERLGQPVVVVNRPGASGEIGTAQAAQARADGHTLLLAHTTGVSILPLVKPRLPYDTARDFRTVSLIAFTPQILFTRPGRFADFAAFRQAAQAAPGRLTYGSGGLAVPPHLTGELLQQVAGLQLSHVPFTGTPPILPALLGGHIDSAIANVPDVTQQIAAGQLVGLALASEQRSAHLPHVPTFTELGVPGVVNKTWFGLLTQSGTPAPIRQALVQAATAVIQSADYQQYIRQQAADAAPVGPAAFDELLQADRRAWGEVVRRAQVVLD